TPLGAQATCTRCARSRRYVAWFRLCSRCLSRITRTFTPRPAAAMRSASAVGARSSYIGRSTDEHALLISADRRAGPACGSASTVSAPPDAVTAPAGADPLAAEPLLVARGEDPREIDEIALHPPAPRAIASARPA